MDDRFQTLTMCPVCRLGMPVRTLFCIKCNRRWTWAEIDAHYCEIFTEAGPARTLPPASEDYQI
jgi:hypothetical protein